MLSIYRKLYMLKFIKLEATFFMKFKINKVFDYSATASGLVLFFLAVLTIYYLLTRLVFLLQSMFSLGVL